MTEYAYAKLNLSLDVTGRREDGYHDMLMVMQTISVSDRIDLELTEEPGIQAECNFRYVPTDGRNLAVRAAQVYLQAVAENQHETPGVYIRLEKHIPVGAGMAGGSADAAAVLRGMNRLFGSPLNRKELEALAGQVGSDVAFCIAGGTQLAKGRGEQLGFSISTPELFRKLDEVSLRRHPDTAGMLAALREEDLRGIGIRMYNVFEDVPDRRMRQTGEIKSVLLDHGALGAMMTGTGSAVFGIFSNAEAAERCAADLKKEHRFCRVAEPVEQVII